MHRMSPPAAARSQPPDRLKLLRAGRTDRHFSRERTSRALIRRASCSRGMARAGTSTTTDCCRRGSRSTSMRPEETDAASRQYQAVIAEILQRLAPGNATRENVDYAFRLLTRGSNFEIDARLCDALQDTVYSAWRAQRQQDASRRLRMSRSSRSANSTSGMRRWRGRIGGSRGRRAVLRNRAGHECHRK